MEKGLEESTMIWREMLRDDETIQVINYDKFHRVKKNEIYILEKYLVFILLWQN